MSKSDFQKKIDALAEDAQKKQDEMETALLEDMIEVTESVMTKAAPAIVDLDYAIENIKSPSAPLLKELKELRQIMNFRLGPALDAAKQRLAEKNGTPLVDEKTGDI